MTIILTCAELKGKWTLKALNPTYSMLLWSHGTSQCVCHALIIPLDCLDESQFLFVKINISVNINTEELSYWSLLINLVNAGYKYKHWHVLNDLVIITNVNNKYYYLIFTIYVKRWENYMPSKAINLPSNSANLISINCSGNSIFKYYPWKKSRR